MDKKREKHLLTVIVLLSAIIIFLIGTSDRQIGISDVLADDHNHDWKVEWNWVSDKDEKYTSAKALMTCSECNEKKEIEAEISTEEDDENIIYTAKIQLSEEEYTDKKIVKKKSKLPVGWNKIAGKWYYVNSDQSYHKGWKKINSKWYYLDNSTGEMKTGWVKDQGNWYFMNKSGVMQKGWLSNNGKWYYMSNSGKASTGWHQIGGKWYYFDKTTCAMKTGWVFDSNKWYYFKSSGEMLKGGWQFIGGKWYYLSVHGDMQTGWLKYNNDWYCLDTNGEMLRNTVVDDYFLNESGKWVNISMAEATGIYSLKLRFADGEVVNVTGIDLKKASYHHYYDNETVPQAIVADAICKYYADLIMAEPSLKTDKDKVATAASVSASFCRECAYGQDSERHYRSPYGVYVGKVFTCAGATRALGRILDYMGYSWTHANENEYKHQWCILKMDGKTGYADGQGYYVGYGKHPEDK